MSAHEEEVARLEKLSKLREKGIDPYPAATHRTHRVAGVLTHFDELMNSQTVMTLTGRIRAIRTHGGIAFVNLVDASGILQIAVKRDVIGDERFDFFATTFDQGDFLEATGTLFVTNAGKQTLLANSVRLLGKALLPLPDKWHGLTDTEQRFRKRYLDLMMNPEVMERLAARARIITALRTFLDSREFIEVETPTLQPIYGGGFARPFTTHHHALDADFFLRISDEMYLKRLIVGGMERVYEITKVFRNEGIDHDHNPEFTMWEAQVAYEDYRFGMDFFEEVVVFISTQAVGGTKIKHGEIEIELACPWKRYRLVDAVKEIGGLDSSQWNSVEEARAALAPKLRDQKKRAEMNHLGTIGEIIAFAFEELVEEKLVQPTMVYDYPVEVSPLAKRSLDPRFTERFEVFVLGSELGNNYSELNDPVDLEKRFIEEKRKQAAGFAEAHQTDVDYLEAIKHGMPPVCGLAIGIDRLVMLLTGTQNIKEVIAFPTLRPMRETE